MQISISNVMMGYQTGMNKKKMPKYPDCIPVGTIFKKINPHGDKEYNQLIFHGSIEDSKGKTIWSFEIEVFFKVDKTLLSKFGDDQKEIENFMKDAFKRSNEVFDNYTANLFLTYSLCPIDNFGVSPSLF